MPGGRYFAPTHCAGAKTLVGRGMPVAEVVGRGRAGVIEGRVPSSLIVQKAQAVGVGFLHTLSRPGVPFVGLAELFDNGGAGWTL